MKEFSLLPLHDAVIRNISISWQEGICSLEMDVFFEAGMASKRCHLIFEGIRSVQIAREQPWGPSVHINRGIQKDRNTFVVEMQSGDLLQFVAAEVKLTTAQCQPDAAQNGE